MIHANQITRQAGEHDVFVDVTFFLPAGSYTHLMGDSGAGKTTLLEMIDGSQRPDTGSLIVNEVDMLDVTAERLPFVRRGLGFVASTTSLLENRSTADNVRMPLDIAGFGQRASTERVAQTLEKLGLTAIANMPVQRLTLDQRWLTAFARATVHRPSVLLVDEPIGLSESTLRRQNKMACQLSLDGATVLSAAPVLGDHQPTLTLELQQGRSFVDGYKTTSH